MGTLDFSSLAIDWVDVQSPVALRAPKGSPRPARRPEDPVLMPNSLVVSPDDSICGTLGEALSLWGIAPTFASTIGQAAPLIASGNLCVVLTQDTLPDGKYSTLLCLQRALGRLAPLIVLSKTGDWPEYFAALDLGAHDFLAYPLVPGELQRTIRSLPANWCGSAAPAYFG
jgi:DNA-binding NtrC family response regulator